MPDAVSMRANLILIYIDLALINSLFKPYAS